MNKIPPAPSNHAFLTKNPRLGFILLIILSASFSFLVSCSRGAQVYGVLEGHVTIGPLVPVVRVGEPEPTPNPEV